MLISLVCDLARLLLDVEASFQCTDKKQGRGTRVIYESGVWGLIFLGRTKWVKRCVVRLCKVGILQIKFKTLSGFCQVPYFILYHTFLG